MTFPTRWVRPSLRHDPQFAGEWEGWGIALREITMGRDVEFRAYYGPGVFYYRDQDSGPSTRYAFGFGFMGAGCLWFSCRDVRWGIGWLCLGESES